MASTQADIMAVMAQEVGRPEIFGDRRAGGFTGNFWKMARFRNNVGLKRARRKPDRIRVWREGE